MSEEGVELQRMVRRNTLKHTPDCKFKLQYQPFDVVELKYFNDGCWNTKGRTSKKEVRPLRNF